MIRIDLEKMLEGLGGKLKRKVTLSEVAEQSGVHRSILSRLINKPLENTSTEHIDKLAQYFFHAYKEADANFEDVDDPGLMQLVLGHLIQVFPEKGSYKTVIDKLSETGDVTNLPIYRLWEFYSASLSQKPITPLSGKRNKLLAKKLNEQEMQSKASSRPLKKK
jgi:hypothetical protein